MCLVGANLGSDLEGRDRLELLRIITGLGYIQCGLAMASMLLLPDPDRSDRGWIVTGVLAIALASTTLLTGRRLPPAAIRFFAVTFAVLITSIGVAVIRPFGPIPLLYVYTTITSAYFTSRRSAFWHWVLLSVTFAVALAVAHAPVREVTWGLTVSMCGVIGVVVVFIREREERLRAKLGEVASRDSLTGLLNRRAFSSAFERELARAERARLPLSLVLFDLDHFKDVNDRFGHAAGDEALRRFALILREECRPGDLTARMGGEEFTAALFGCDGDDARAWAERVAARLREEAAADGVPLSTSGGIAFAEHGGATLEPMLQRADRALYAAKAAGRRRIEVAA